MIQYIKRWLASRVMSHREIWWWQPKPVHEGSEDMPVVSCREMTQMFFCQSPGPDCGQGKWSATLRKLFFSCELANTFLCSTEKPVQSIIHKPKNNRVIHYYWRTRAGNQKRRPKTSPEGRHETWPCTARVASDTDDQVGDSLQAVAHLTRRITCKY